MILNDTPSNEAILSNVGSVNSFTIKATAKSFKILSDGLYANKIKAIIRELSCNALDSHVAAGNMDIPFVVHLPNAIEPWFSVRDFGTGLNHDQVVNIFTTFFESTKTGSNDFIGALGLGSKSPFSYTDNFTVVATQNGHKGIYTAFINEVGVPSIALMMSEDTDEPSGVEIKFAVAERYDFRRFQEEAVEVFKFWRNRPTVTGASNFQFADPQYKDRDIIPGVHSVNDPYRNGSIAVMGNIAYRIEVPSTDTVLGELRGMLDCGLVLEFAIGELDFQASREGLSYIPLTVNSIKTKLEALRTQLTVHLTAEADKIDNLWERAAYLQRRSNEALWASAVNKYLTDTGFPLINPSSQRWDAIKRFELPVDRLAADYNIVIRAFSRARHNNTCQSLKTDQVRDTSTGTPVLKTMWRIAAEMDRHFVFNDTKVGALERAKFHWRKRDMPTYTEYVYVMEPADKTKPMKRTEFLAEIMNPPLANIMDASALVAKERAAGLGKNVSILRLESQSRGSRGYRYADTVVWKDAGKADQYDAAKTYYYLPLSGYKSLGKIEDVKWLKDTLEKSDIFTGHIYGVRKSDAEWVQAQSNWVNLDTMAEAKLAAMSDADVMGIVKEAIGFKDVFHWSVTHLDATSLYAQLAAEFKDVKGVDGVRRNALQALCREYKVVTATVDPQALIATYQSKMDAVKARYPLLTCIGKYSAEDRQIADYIRLVDRDQVIQNA